MLSINEILLACRKGMVGRKTAGMLKIDDVNIEVDAIDFSIYQELEKCNLSYYSSPTEKYPIYWVDITLPDIDEKSIPGLLASKIVEIDDTYFFNGMYGHEGVLHNAGNAHTQHQPFSISGNALEVIHRSVNLIQLDNGFGTYNLYLHPAQYLQLFQSSDGMMNDYDRLRSVLEGEIMFSRVIPENSGILILQPSPGRNYINYVLHKDWQFNQLTPDTWRVWFSASPLLVTNPNLMCLLENI